MAAFISNNAPPPPLLGFIPPMQLTTCLHQSHWRLKGQFDRERLWDLRIWREMFGHVSPSQRWPRCHSTCPPTSSSLSELLTVQLFNSSPNLHSLSCQPRQRGTPHSCSSLPTSWMKQFTSITINPALIYPLSNSLGAHSTGGCE